MNKYSGNLSYEEAKQKVADFVTDYVYQFTTLTDKDYLENNTIYLKDIQAIARFFEGANELEEENKKLKNDNQVLKEILYGGNVSEI